MCTHPRPRHGGRHLCTVAAAQVIGAPKCVAGTNVWQGEAVGVFEGRPIVGGQIVAVGDIALTRAIALMPTSGSAVAAGALTLAWTAVPGAISYCVGFADQTANAFVPLAGARCGRDPEWAATNATTLTLPALAARHSFFGVVYALDRTADASFMRLCYDQPSATFTCLGHGESTFTTR